MATDIEEVKVRVVPGTGFGEPQGAHVFVNVLFRFILGVLHTLECRSAARYRATWWRGKERCHRQGSAWNTVEIAGYDDEETEANILWR